MKRIGRDNYQEWALDYIEGNLDEAKRLEFERFLSTDGESYDEVRSLMDGMPVLPVPCDEFPDKASFIRGNIFRRVLPYFSGAAAASVLIALCTWLVPSGTVQQGELLGDLSKETGDKRVEHYEPLKKRDADVGAMQSKPGLVEKKQAPVLIAEPASAPVKDAHEDVKARTSEIVAPVIPETDDREFPQTENYETPVMADNLFYGSVIAETGAGIIMERHQMAVPSHINIADTDELLAYRDASVEEDDRSGVGETIVKGVSMLLSPLPITKFETNKERGIEIASLIRISRKTSK